MSLLCFLLSEGDEGNFGVTVLQIILCQCCNVTIHRYSLRDFPRIYCACTTYTLYFLCCLFYCQKCAALRAIWAGKTIYSFWCPTKSLTATNKITLWYSWQLKATGTRVFTEHKTLNWRWSLYKNCFFVPRLEEFIFP